MDTERRSTSMRLEIGLTSCVAVVWAVLGLAYALAPWGDMIGYAWVWGAGSVLFVGLALALRRSARAGGAPVSDGRPIR